MIARLGLATLCIAVTVVAGGCGEADEDVPAARAGPWPNAEAEIEDRVANVQAGFFGGAPELVCAQLTVAGRGRIAAEDPGRRGCTAGVEALQAAAAGPRPRLGWVKVRGDWATAVMRLGGLGELVLQQVLREDGAWRLSGIDDVVGVGTTE